MAASEVGTTEYIRVARDDGRMGPEHQALDGTRHRGDTPPSAGHPGEATLCRCVAIPVLDTVKKIPGKTAPPDQTPTAAEKEVKTTETPMTHCWTRRKKVEKPEKPPTPTNDDHYPEMKFRERFVETKYPTSRDFDEHTRIPGYFDAEEDELVKYFISGGADAIRREMNLYGELKSEKTKAMDQRISELATTGDKNRIVWRGMSGYDDLLSKLRVGKTIDIDSPTSTSTSIGVSKKFARGDKSVMLRVHLPEKIKRLVTNPRELEMTIPRGHRFRVVRVYEKPMDVIAKEDRRRIEKWVDVVVERADSIK